MHLVDMLCRIDRVRDVYQPRMKSAPEFTECNAGVECKQIRFGGANFVMFEHNMKSILTWIHEFTEQSVHQIITREFGEIDPRWPGIIIHRPTMMIGVTPYHILASLVAYGVGDGATELGPDDYWSYLMSSGVQTRITEYLEGE